MAYARKTNQGELVQLRDEITHEVNTDAEHLATSVFGDLGDHPDMQRMDNEQIDGLYRAAYERQDRQFLQAEARRDPAQFMKVAQRLGVSLPPPPPPSLPVPPPPAPAVATPLPALPPPPPVVAPVAAVSPAPVAVAAPPLVPSVAAPLEPDQPVPGVA
jgi:hypothetical protein